MRTERAGGLAAAVLALATWLGAGPLPAAEVRITEGTNLSVDVSPADGSLVIDLLGNLWQVPARGGDAKRLTEGVPAARRPRFSPSGDAILYQADALPGPQLWRYDLATGDSVRLGSVGEIEQHGDWHPGGARVVFAAAHHDTGLDLWERDLATGLEWRLTSHPGDESAPAWSANGRHLTYVLHENDRWHLMLRRFGHQPVAIVDSESALHAPSWRPDGTLVTYLQADGERLVLRMVILSDPPLARTLAVGEDYFTAPVSWKGRDRLYYTADGTIKTRAFDGRRSRRLRFSAAIARPGERPASAPRARELPDSPATGGDLVIRAARLYDGEDPDYRRDVDIVVRDGRIEEVVPRRDHGDRFVIDIGDVTVMPGLIDVYAPMPGGDPATSGARTLAFGVTTLVTPDAPADFDASVWNSEETPGPRLLRAAAASEEPGKRVDAAVRLALIADKIAGGESLAPRVRAWQEHGLPVLAPNWSVGLGVGADLLLGAAVLPASPRGRRYDDVRLVSGNGPLTFVTGLAGPGTAGIDGLARSRQAEGLPQAIGSSRRIAGSAPFGQGGAELVLGSRPSGLPAGFSTQAELRALQAAGLPPSRVLAAATGVAARTIGAARELGRIVPGARADLVLVAGDPLRNVDEALGIVAVVRDGHFFSLSTLLERAGVE